jgi:hypothetical protein
MVHALALHLDLRAQLSFKRTEPATHPALFLSDLPAQHDALQPGSNARQLQDVRDAGAPARILGQEAPHEEREVGTAVGGQRRRWGVHDLLRQRHLVLRGEGRPPRHQLEHKAPRE